MMDSEYTALIERYFDNLLLPNEEKLVADLLANNSDFKLEFQLFEKANKAVELQALSELKNTIKKMDSRKEVRSFTFLKIAASILLIAVIGSFFYAQTQLTNSKIFLTSYELAPDYITNMGDNQDVLSIAMKYYNTQNFDSAIKAFLPLASNNEEAAFYLGQCYLKTTNTQKAISTFSSITGKYKTEAEWYTALAQLSAGNEKGARGTLNQIIKTNQDEAFVLKAKHVLKKLDNPLRQLLF